MSSSSAREQQARRLLAKTAFFSHEKPKAASPRSAPVSYPGWLRLSVLIGGVVGTWAGIFLAVSFLF